jgi:hypothetical protein
MNLVRVILTLFPFVWIAGMIPFVNRVRPIVMGLPFLAFWLVMGIPVTFICLSILYKIDSKRSGDSQ